MPINATWHRANPMPKNATLDQRVDWHLAHLRECACRTDLPKSVREEIARRDPTFVIPTGAKRSGGI